MPNAIVLQNKSIREEYVSPRHTIQAREIPMVSSLRTTAKFKRNSSFLKRGKQGNYTTFPHDTSPLLNRSPQSFAPHSIFFGWFLEQLQKTFARDPLWAPPTLDDCIVDGKSCGKRQWENEHSSTRNIMTNFQDFSRTPNKYIIIWFAQSKIADVARCDLSKIQLTYVEDEGVLGTAS